jgi:hypothetical protein
MLTHTLWLHKRCFNIGSSVIYMLMFLTVLYALLKLNFWNWYHVLSCLHNSKCFKFMAQQQLTETHT